MLGDGHCDAECDNSECDGDGHDCECAPGCRFKELATCKEECMVPQCGFGRMPGYASCSEFWSNVQIYKAILAFWRSEHVIAPLLNFELCGGCLREQPSTHCIDGSQCASRSCSFGQCSSSSDCEILAVSSRGPACLKCREGLVNDYGYCRESCSPGLGLYPLLENQCFPFDDSTPEHPDVFYVNDNAEYTDFGQRLSFSSLSDALESMKKQHIRILLSAQHFFTVQQPSRFLSNPIIDFGRPAPTFEDHTLNITLVPACTDCRATVHVDSSNIPQISLDRGSFYYTYYCVAMPTGFFTIERVDFTMDGEAIGPISGLFVFGAWKVVFRHVSFWGIMGLSSLIYLHATSNITMVDVSFDDISVTESILVTPPFECDEGIRISGELLYTNGTISAVRAKSILDIDYFHSATVSGLTVQFVEVVDFLSVNAVRQVTLSDCRFLYNRFRGGAALHVYPIMPFVFEYLHVDFLHFGDPTKADFLIENSLFRGNEAENCLFFDFDLLPQSVRVTNCDFHDEQHTILTVDKSSPVRRSDIYGVGRYVNGVRRNADPIFIDLQHLGIQNCAAAGSHFSVSNFSHVSASGLTVTGSPETEECVTTFAFSNCFNVTLASILVTDVHCARGCLVLNSSSTTGGLSIASTLITQSSGEELLSISTADRVTFSNFTVSHSSATRLINLTDVGISVMRSCSFEGTEAHEAVVLCGAALCQIVGSRFVLNHARNGGVVQLPASTSLRASLEIQDSRFDGNQVDRAVVLVQSTLKSQPSQMILRHLNFTNNAAVTAVVLISTRTTLANDSEIHNCRFHQNIAGGGVLRQQYEQGALTISQSQFTENEGGAISFVHSSVSVAPRLHIRSMRVASNRGSAVHIHSSLSGSVFSASDLMLEECTGTSVVLQKVQGEVANCTFRNNNAAAGGALALEQSSVVRISNCTFSHNSATSKGGAVVVAEGSLLLCDSCTFAGNSAATGGAISISPDAAVDLLHCLLEENSAVDGSAMHSLMSAASVAANCEFRRNRATDEATIAMFFSALTLRNCTVQDNGGQMTPGVVLSLSNLTVEFSTFAGHRGNTGTVLHATMRSIVDISASQFRDSESQSGAIYADDTLIDISNSAFQSMSADYGSAIVSLGNSRLVFSDSTVNSQWNSKGGALYISQSVCTVVNSRFSALNNSAVYSKRSSIALSMCHFYSNSHPDITVPVGGGLNCQDCESVQVVGCAFIGLKATSGAGVFISNSRPTNLFSIETSTFQDNSAWQAAGIHADTAALVVKECVFTNNMAESRGGAVVLLCADSCTQSVQRCRFVMNRASSHGGAIAWPSGAPSFVANQLQANTAPYGPDVSSFSTSLFLMNSTLPAVASGQVFPSALVVEVRDHYNQTVLVDNSTTAELAVLSGDVYGTVTATAAKGRLTFSGFSLVGQKSTTIRISSAELQSHLAIDVSFRNCVMGEFETRGLCVVCGPGTFSVDPVQPCTECDKHANCLGSYLLTPLPGYWRPSNHSTRLYKCPNPDACLGPPDLTGTCATGYTGNMCQTCAVNYVRYVKTHCQPCPSRDSIILLTVGLTVGAILFSAVLVVTSIKSAYKVKSQLSLSLKVLTNYLQLVMMMGSFNLSWPTLTKRLLSIQDSAGGVSEHIFAPGCLRSNYVENDDFYWKVLSMAFVPLGVLSLSSVLWALWALVQRQSSILRNELVGSATILFFLVHPNVIRVMFSALNCEEVDGEHWVVGLQQRCWQGEHWKYAVATALPSILLWGVGVPALMLLFMSRHRNRLNELQVRVRFGYLFNGYSPEKYYWEFIVIYRKLVVISLAVFLSRLPQVVPALATLGVLVLSFALQETHQPFRLATFNLLEHRSLLVSFVTLFCGLYFLFGGLNTIVETLFFAVIVGVNVLFLQYWVRATFKTWAANLANRLPCLQRNFVVLGEGRVVTLRQHRAIYDLAQRARFPLTLVRKKLYYSRVFKQLALHS